MTLPLKTLGLLCLISCINGAPQQRFVNVLRADVGSPPLTQVEVISLDNGQSVRTIGRQPAARFVQAASPSQTRLVQVVPQATRLVRPQATRLVRPQTTRLVRPQTTRLVRPQATRLVRPQTTRLVRPQATRLVQTVPAQATRFVESVPVQTARFVQTVPAAQATRLVERVPLQTTRLVQSAAPVRSVEATHLVRHHQPQAIEVREAPRASYQFGYSVADTLTGDSKTREEERDGDVVRGSYSVADPDGRIRTVTYTADAVNGFQADVRYDGEVGPPSISTQTSSPQTAQVIAARTQSVLTLPSDDPTRDIPVVQTVRGSPATVVSTDNAVHAVHAEPLQQFRTVPTAALVRTSSNLEDTAIHHSHHTRTHPTSVLQEGARFVQLGGSQVRAIPVVGLRAGTTFVSADSFGSGGATFLNDIIEV